MIIMHSYVWFKVNPFVGAYWTSCERDFHEFATFYRVPEISTKAACHRLMAAGGSVGSVGMVGSVQSTGQDRLVGSVASGMRSHTSK